MAIDRRPLLVSSAPASTRLACPPPLPAVTHTHASVSRPRHACGAAPRHATHTRTPPGQAPRTAHRRKREENDSGMGRERSTDPCRCLVLSLPPSFASASSSWLSAHRRSSRESGRVRRARRRRSGGGRTQLRVQDPHEGRRTQHRIDAGGIRSDDNNRQERREVTVSDCAPRG